MVRLRDFINETSGPSGPTESTKKYRGLPLRDIHSNGKYFDHEVRKYLSAPVFIVAPDNSGEDVLMFYTGSDSKGINYKDEAGRAYSFSQAQLNNFKEVLTKSAAEQTELSKDFSSR